MTDSRLTSSAGSPSDAGTALLERPAIMQPSGPTPATAQTFRPPLRRPPSRPARRHPSKARSSAWKQGILEEQGQPDQVTRRQIASLSKPKPSASDSLPDLVLLSKLPGPNSMRLLTQYRLVEPLDPNAAYLSERASGIFGRAAIAKRLIPYGTTACNSLASWVWSGGLFPPYLDVVSSSHFRTPMYSHPLRVHNRKLPFEHMMKLGRLWTTSPLRTACDLACEERSDEDNSGKVASLHTLMEQYQVSSNACLNLLAANPRWPGHNSGIETFNLLRKLA
ncbi:hypothetical protein KIMH_14090 [Bombiscardovia apis]|uniref:Uncharacterized protein n=1 Tax=Bombiscardovia apis TaxID=2932182 RepID=A0ABM8BEE3_9BIFI|nr:hypothetical protein [Bombiscardovia apis]BDR55298.1 hypothetical protein KIMH_14090 [Bombiscardovia apis]